MSGRKFQHKFCSGFYIMVKSRLQHTCPPCIPCPPPPCCNPTPPCVVKKYKVTICGANGQLGQMIAFLLKQSPIIDTICLYDITKTDGTAMDISHIDSKCRVAAYTGEEELPYALTNADVVLIAAGVGRVVGMSLNQLFEYNAPVVKSIAENMLKTCPKALIGVLTNPINSLVPMISKLYKLNRCYDPNRIFGVTGIDSMRACSLVTSEVLQGTGNPAEYQIPVIGGHSCETMVPVLSQTSPCMIIPNGLRAPLIERIRSASSLVLSVKKSSGGPRLSVALAAARFTNNLIRGLRGESSIIDLAYVYTDQVPGVCYFSCPVELGPCGILRNFGLVRVEDMFERPYLTQAIEHLKCDIKTGEDYLP